MKVIVTLAIELDEDAWTRAYGTEGKRAIAADVRQSVAIEAEAQIRADVTPHCWVSVRNR